MKANELRIGNLVYIGKEVNELELVDFADLYENDTFKHFEPIPLTEEWLFKFGFEKDDDWLELVVNDHLSIIWVGYLGLNVMGQILFFSKKDKIHELQNLYFALTGEELTLSE